MTTQYNPSQIAAFKLALIREHGIATRGWSDADVYAKARDLGLTGDAQPQAPEQAPEAQPEAPEVAVPVREQMENLLRTIETAKSGIKKHTEKAERLQEQINHLGSMSGDDSYDQYMKAIEQQNRSLEIVEFLNVDLKNAEQALAELQTTNDNQQGQNTMQAQPQAQNAAAQLAQLIAQMAMPQAPQIDESRIVELIKKHTTPAPRETVVTMRRDGLPDTTTNVGVTHSAFPACLHYLKSGLNIFLHGRSGSGKSTTVQKLAQALDMEFYGMGSILTKFELLGSFTKDQYNPSVVRKWLENPNGGVLCIDEIDGSDPRALVNTMPIFDKNGQLTFLDGKTFKRTEKHLIAVTANTTGAGSNAAYVGRCKLDAATLNRFIRIEHDYDLQIERTLASENIVRMAHRVRDMATEKGFDGTLVTPRTIAQAGDLERDIEDKSLLRQLIMPLFRQGLTEREWQPIENVVNGMAL